MAEEPPRTQEIVEFVEQKPRITAWKEAFSTDGLFTLEHMDALAWYIYRRETHGEHTETPLGVTLLRLVTLIVDRFGTFPDMWGRQPRPDATVLDLWTMSHSPRRIKPHVYFLVHVLDPSCYSPRLYCAWGLSVGNRLDTMKVPRCSAVNSAIFERYGVPIPPDITRRSTHIPDHCNLKIILGRHVGTIALNYTDLITRIDTGGWSSIEIMLLLSAAAKTLSDNEILTIHEGQHYSLFSLFMSFHLIQSISASRIVYNDMIQRYHDIEFTMVPEYARMWAQFGCNSTGTVPNSDEPAILVIAGMLSQESRKRLVQDLRSIESWVASEVRGQNAPPLRQIIETLCPFGSMTKAAMCR